MAVRSPVRMKGLDRHPGGQSRSRPGDPRSEAHLGTSPALVRSAKTESPKPAMFEVPISLFLMGKLYNALVARLNRRDSSWRSQLPDRKACWPLCRRSGRRVCSPRRALSRLKPIRTCSSRVDEGDGCCSEFLISPLDVCRLDDRPLRLRLDGGGFTLPRFLARHG
jgi:hypothetical protein